MRDDEELTLDNAVDAVFGLGCAALLVVGAVTAVVALGALLWNALGWAWT